MDREIIRKVFIWTVALVLVILLPTSLGMQHQSTERALILGFAVDKVEADYEVSMQVLIPQYKQSFSEKIEVVSSKGKTIDLALDSTRLKIGKKLGVAHANMIVLSEAVLQENIMRVLDYFYRDRYLGNYSIVLATSDSAKDLLQMSSQTDNASLNSLVNIIKYNDENILGRPSNLHTIATGYYSPSRTCFMPFVTLEKSGAGSSGGNSTSGGGSSGGSGETSQTSGGGNSGAGSGSGDSGASSSQSQSGKSGGASGGSSHSGGSSESGGSSGASGGDGGSSGSGASSGSGGETQGGSENASGGSEGATTIKNEGAVVVLKDGVALCKLSGDEFRGFGWLLGSSNGVLLELDGISDDVYENAKVVVEVVSTRVKLKYEVGGLGEPIVRADIAVDYKISSAVQELYESERYADYVEQDTAALEGAIAGVVETEISAALSLAKMERFDIWNVYDRFHQYHTREFGRYVEAVEGDYLRGLEVFATVHSSEIRL